MKRGKDFCINTCLSAYILSKKKAFYLTKNKKRLYLYKTLNSMIKYRLSLQTWGVDENNTRSITTTIMEGDELPIKAAFYSTLMDLSKDFNENEIEQKGKDDYLCASEEASVKIKMEQYEEV